MQIHSFTLEQALEALGQLLSDRGLHYEVIIIGAGGLLLLGQIDRTTKDLDLVALLKDSHLISVNPLPRDLLQAADEVGRALRLDKDWLNPGPSALFEMGLPQGFKTRLITRKYAGLIVHLAGRFDPICFKLYAAVDQGQDSKHFFDLKALEPTKQELQKATQWCLTQDGSKVFANELNTAVATLEAIDANT